MYVTMATQHRIVRKFTLKRHLQSKLSTSSNEANLNNPDSNLNDKSTVYVRKNGILEVCYFMYIFNKGVYQHCLQRHSTN